MYSISISPENIDVNVHPTKHEVHFLHEDRIIECIQKTIEERLLSCTSSRTYYTQSLLPSKVSNFPTGSLQHEKKSAEDVKVYDYRLVRTDTKGRKLDAYALPKSLTDEVSYDLAGSHQKSRKKVHLTSIVSLQSDIKKNKHDGVKYIPPKMIVLCYNNHCRPVQVVLQTHICLLYRPDKMFSSVWGTFCICSKWLSCLFVMHGLYRQGST